MKKTQRATLDRQHVEALIVHYQISLSQAMANWHSFVGLACSPHVACVSAQNNTDSFLKYSEDFCV